MAVVRLTRLVLIGWWEGLTKVGRARASYMSLSHPSVTVGTMTITSLRLVDPHNLDDDDDTWIESCLQCGTLENCGDNLCPSCDDLAA